MVGSLMDSRRMILLNSPHKETKNGAIATFKTDMARPLIDLIIDIKAVQAGSGDPSPENERPISGFNAVDVTRCRKNFFDKSATIQAYVDTSGNLISNAANLALNRFIPVKNGDIITLSSNATMFALGVALYDNNKTFIRRVLKTNDSICKLTANADGFILCSFNYNNAIHTIEEWSTIVDNLQIQLEFANERTAYTPYNGNTYNISWEDEVGTVYGGTLDVKNGILTATCQTIHKSISQGVSHPVHDGFIQYDFNFDYRTVGVSTDNEKKKCSIAPYAYQSGNFTHFYILQRGAMLLTVPADTPTDLEFDCICPLETPTTYQLTPTTIRSLLGQNNIWADTGNTTVKYWTH